MAGLGTLAIINSNPKTSAAEKAAAIKAADASTASSLGNATSTGGLSGGGTGVAATGSTTVPAATAPSKPAANSSTGGMSGGGTGVASTLNAPTSLTDSLKGETRYSDSEISFIRSNYEKGKMGRVAPAAALLEPYRGYGGPRGTPIGAANTTTATKMLLGV